MRPLAFVPLYIRWHYTQALRNIIHITNNFLWFAWHFFSIGLLFRTLFSPWQRLEEHATKDFDIQVFFSRLIVNTIVRIFGAIFRLVFIVLGLVMMILMIGGSILFFIAWIAMPFLISFLIILGLSFIVNLQ